MSLSAVNFPVVSGYQTRIKPSFGLVIGALLLLWTSVSSAKPLKEVKVEVITASQHPLIEEVFLSGTVVAPKVANLSVQVSGQVNQLSVDLGQMVKAGAEIVRLDAELERLALEESRAATEQARQELEDAKRRLADAKRVIKHDGISANQLELLKTEVLIDQAELKRKQAQQNTAEARLKRYRVYAPFEGVVSQKHTEIGEWLNQGMPVVSLTAVSNLNIDFQLPQTLRDRLTPQTEIEVSFEDGRATSYQAEVVWLMPVANPQSRTLHLRTRLIDHNQNNPVVPGMSARAVLHLSSNQKGVAVPRDALIRHPDGRVTVWVVKRSGDKSKVVERLVQTGLKFRELVAIDGVDVGEQIVVKGNESLRGGMHVTLQASNPKEQP